MTVISAVITQHCTAHASDSLLTRLESDGTRRPIEYEKSKLVYVKHWRGAAAFWGLAESGHWSTLEWLRGQAQHAHEFSSAEEFANQMAAVLNRELARLPSSSPVDKGIGIHFTTYERVSDYWIPELFLISNWEGIPYTHIRRKGGGASRETYHTLKGVVSAPQHGEPRFRFEVHEALLSGTMFRYNNGDPELFSPVADATIDTLFRLMRRGSVNDPSSKETHCALARRPIEIISHLLTDFSKEGTRLIGGKPHDLCISHDGTWLSTTGDY
jgi:hypothetical protein